MTKQENPVLTIKAVVNTPVDVVWRMWTEPAHITQWNHASDDWHSPHAENDLRVDGKFSSTMAAKDGSMSFDFAGVYTEVETHKKIAYVLGDGRKVEAHFLGNGNSTEIIQHFEPETENPFDFQQAGWQAILDNFKKYTEESQRIDTLHYEITIDQPVAKVYSTMIGAESYKAWTSIFNPTSQFRGSWEKGSKILFIGTDENGNEGGMVSRIKENIPNEFISIEHLGILAGEEEQMNTSWAGSLENYTFREFNGKTLLIIDIDSNQEFKGYFDEMWPLALIKLKEICEQ